MRRFTSQSGLRALGFDAVAFAGGDGVRRDQILLDHGDDAGRYAAAQRDAEREGSGVWTWLFRAFVRANGAPASCSDDANSHI
jgi:hypothetical protein